MWTSEAKWEKNREGEEREGEINRQRGGDSKRCRVHRRYENDGNERREREKEGKGRKGSKTSDAKGRADGQMKEGSSRAGNGFEERKRANGGPCLTNCHLRWASVGGDTTTVERLQIAHSERCTQAPPNTSSCMHRWTHTLTQTHTQTQWFRYR